MFDTINLLIVLLVCIFTCIVLKYLVHACKDYCRIIDDNLHNNEPYTQTHVISIICSSTDKQTTS